MAKLFSIIRNNKWIRALSMSLGIMYTVQGLSQLAFINGPKHPLAPQNTYRKALVPKTMAEYFSQYAKKTVDDKANIDEIFPLQLMLHTQGHDLGPCQADGIWGEHTQSAVRDFQLRVGLPATGVADAAVLQKITSVILRDERAVQSLSREWFARYQSPDILQFMKQLPNIFEDNGVDLLLRPDIGGTALADLIFLRKARLTVAEKIFPECASYHRRDAYRHTVSFFQFSNLFWVGPRWAERLGNLHERRDQNEKTPLGSMLMDMFNHGAAARRAAKMKAEGKPTDDIPTIFADMMQKGELVRYPFPLIKRDVP